MELCHPVGSAVGRQCLQSAFRGDLVVPLCSKVSASNIRSSGLCCLRSTNSETLSRSRLDNLCGPISSEGPYTFSMLLLYMRLRLDKVI